MTLFGNKQSPWQSDAETRKWLGFLLYLREISFSWRSQIPRSIRVIICSESILLYYLDTVRLANMAPGKIGVAYLKKMGQKDDQWDDKN